VGGVVNVSGWSALTACNGEGHRWRPEVDEGVCVPVKPHPFPGSKFEHLSRSQRPSLRLRRAGYQRLVAFDLHDRDDLAADEGLDDLASAGSTAEQALGAVLPALELGGSASGLPAERAEQRHVCVLFDFEATAEAELAVDPRLSPIIEEAEEVLQVGVGDAHIQSVTRQPVANRDTSAAIPDVRVGISAVGALGVVHAEM
jgi:hypothetical protein